MRGQPQPVSALTTASTDDVLAVLFVEADTANVGEIMRRMLARFGEPALCVFEPASGRIIGTTDADTRTAILGVWQAAAVGETIVQPAGPGVLTLWTATLDEIGLAATIANAIQKRSFYNVINAALGLFPLGEPACIADQIEGEIRFKFADLSALAALEPAGQTVCVQFAPPKTKHSFE